jgi:hypothetical protein
MSDYLSAGEAATPTVVTAKTISAIFVSPFSADHTVNLHGQLSCRANITPAVLPVAHCWGFFSAQLMNACIIAPWDGAPHSARAKRGLLVSTRVLFSGPPALKRDFANNSPRPDAGSVPNSEISTSHRVGSPGIRRSKICLTCDIDRLVDATMLMGRDSVGGKAPDAATLPFAKLGL